MCVKTTTNYEQLIRNIHVRDTLALHVVHIQCAYFVAINIIQKFSAFPTRKLYITRKNIKTKRKLLQTTNNNLNKMGRYIPNPLPGLALALKLSATH